MTYPTRGVNGTQGRRTTIYAVTFATVPLGLVDIVDLTKLKMILKAITSGTTGEQVLGDQVRGVNGSISLDLAELDNYQYQTLAPWWSGTGTIPLFPPIGADLYTYSAALLLHPQDRVAGTTEDITFANACPISLPGCNKADNKNFLMAAVEFKVYPSRTALASSLLSGGVASIANA
jgi:hypothetical protein